MDPIAFVSGEHTYAYKLFDDDLVIAELLDRDVRVEPIVPAAVGAHQAGEPQSLGPDPQPRRDGVEDAAN